MKKPLEEPVLTHDQWVSEVMDQAQVFASSWSLVGGQFDHGQMLQDAEQAKADLKALLLRHPNYREVLADRLMEVWFAEKGQMPWSKAIQILAIVTKLPESERVRLLFLDEETASKAKPLPAAFIEAHIGVDEGDREAVVAIVREVEKAHGIGLLK